MKYSERMNLLEVVLQVLRCNGYTEAEWTSAAELIFDLMFLEDDIGDARSMLDLYDTDVELPEDLFPYVCLALSMDRIPEYRIRPKSDPPVPEWLDEMRRSEGFREEDLDWDEVRRILDEGESPEDYWEFLWPGEWDPFAYPGPWTDEGDPYEDEELQPDETEEYVEPPHYGSGIFAGMSFSWPEYGITLDEEYLDAMAQLMDAYYVHYFDLALEESKQYAEYWEYDPQYPQLYYDNYVLCGYPDFGRVGRFEPYKDGIYSTWSDYDDEALYADGDLTYMDISEDGIWVQFDPYTGEILDCGILVPGAWTMGAWYSVTTGGEFFTLWPHDIGVYTSTLHGGLVHHWKDGQWEAYKRYYGLDDSYDDYKISYGD
jgi:hypothetical protein